MTSSSSDFWNHSLALTQASDDELHALPFLIKYLPLIVGLLGIFIAYIIYINTRKIAYFISKKLNFIYKVLLNKYYFDKIYNFLFVDFTKKMSNILWKIFDNSIIDGIPNILARCTYNISRISRCLQTGAINHYSLIMFIGLLSIMIFIVFY